MAADAPVTEPSSAAKAVTTFAFIALPFWIVTG
jgi:hypothetical protein